MPNENNLDEHNHDTKTDELLRQVLKDDLPPQVEARMKAQFMLFRENVERDQQPLKISAAMADWRRFFNLKWAVRREVLAFSSLAMIVAGAFLHVSGHRSAMAETLSFLNSSLSVAAKVRYASSMECRMRFPAENGKHRSSIIRWVSPDVARVDLIEHGKPSQTLLIYGEDITLADHFSNDFLKYQSLEPIKETDFAFALEFLSPIALATSMYEKWKPQHFELKAHGQKAAFFFLNNGEKASLEMIVDLDTQLPLTLKKYSLGPSDVEDVYELAMEAQFLWNEIDLLKKIDDQTQQGRDE